MKKIILKKSVSLLVVVAFLLQTFSAYGQLSPSFQPSALSFQPATLRYLSVNSANPYNYFNFLLDRGSRFSVSGSRENREPNTDNLFLNQEARKLINFFFLGITLPDEDFWVNLRPDEPGRITSDALSKTEMGKILLNQDLQLKREAAKLLNPNNPTGQIFWNKLYSEAEKLLGKNKLKKTPIDTSNRVWIVPDSATVMETDDGAFVVYSKLKVLLENEYLAAASLLRADNPSVIARREAPKQSQKETIQLLTERLMKEIVIPEITKEVNEGQSFAPLRQIYNSLILAQWFKRKYRNSQSIYSQAIGKGSTQGLESELPWERQAIWQDYLKSYKQGEYKFQDKFFGLNRMYFSGGMALNLGVVSSPLAENPDGFKLNIIKTVDSPALEKKIKDSEDNFIPAFTEKSRKDSRIAPETIKILAKGSSSSSLNDNKKEKPGLFERARRALSSLAKGPGKQLQEIPIGVQLEHFVWAQNRLAGQNLSEAELSSVLSKLGLNSNLTGEAAYNKIYEKLSEGNYTKELIDLINGNTYKDPRLNIEIIGQNSNPRSQGVLEAVANSLDALGTNIGQFGKGVKQIIDWLEPTGEDRIDVFTLEENGIPYQLTIIKDTQAQNNIGIRKITLQEFQDMAGQGITRGTVVKVTVKNKILRTSEDLGKYSYSQEGLIESIHKRFPYVTSVRITTQIGHNAPEKVNGFEEKNVIVPSDAPSYSSEESEGKNIQVVLDDNTITIIDNGKGMDAQIISRMFVPRQTSKHPEPLSKDKAQEELKKLKVVQDKTLPHRISFARNGEVVVAVDVPGDIQNNATVEGGLMVEFGSLMDVPESRNNIIIPLDLKPGEVTNFELAVNYAIKQIINHPRLSNVDKIKYINSIIVGLDGLVKGNENYGYVVKNIRAATQKALSGIIGLLKNEGFIILPHDKQFEKLAMPDGKKVLFMHERLFDWQGAVNLKEIGGRIIPGITLGGEKHIPLVVIPFKQGSLGWILRFNRLWHTSVNGERLPIIKTNKFVAIPEELGKRLNELAQRRAKGLTKEEEKEFVSLLQRVNIITAEEVATAYELTKPKENMRVIPQKEFEKSIGEVDSEAINGFLTKPPVIPSQAGPQMINQVPTDANQKFILLENGELLDIESGRRIGKEAELIREGVEKIEALRRDYYRVKTKSSDRIVKFWRGGDHRTELIAHEGGYFSFSPDKRFAYVQYHDGTVDPVVFDLETGEKYYFESDFSTMAMLIVPRKLREMPQLSTSTYYTDLQFSKDSRYLTYLKKNNGRATDLVIIDLSQSETAELKTSIGSGWGSYLAKPFVKKGGKVTALSLNDFKVKDFSYAVNPYANVVFVRDKDTGEMTLIDLTGSIAGTNPSIVVSGVKALHTDSSGAYTVIINNKGNEMFIYQHDSKEMLTKKDFGNRKIEAVVTKWQNGAVLAYGVRLENGTDMHFTKDHRPFVNPVGEEDYSEAFEEHGWAGLRGKGAPTYTWDEGKNDPLQTLNRKRLYKHPHFNLLIDNSDANNLLAIDPVTWHKFSYKGKVISYDSSREALYYFYEGKSVYERYYLVDNLVEDFPPVESVVIDGVPAKFMVHLNDNKTRWQLYHFPFIDDMIPISPEYSSVYFDGKYFVFVNPKTGAVAYLDPQKSAKPFFVSAQPAPTAILTDQKPAEAPERFTIRQGADGGYKVFDVNTGIPQHAEPYKHIERVNSNTFIGYYENGRFVIFTIQNGVFWAVYASEAATGKEKIVAHSDTLFVVEKEGIQYAFGTHEGGRTIGESAKDIYLSSSGKFAVFASLKGLNYYSPGLGKKTIIESGQYQEYFVHDRADVVIIKDKNGKYMLFSLSLGKELVSNAEHIEIDSSGTVAIVKTLDSGLSGINLMNSLRMWGIAMQVMARVAANEKYIYYEGYFNSGKSFKSIIDKESGQDITETMLGKTAMEQMPRFSEMYTLEDKTIWDNETNQRITAKIGSRGNKNYNESDRREPGYDKDLLLFGSILLNEQWLIDRQIESNVFDLEAIKEPTGKPTLALIAMPIEGKVIALNKRKVWYVQKPDGTAQVTTGSNEGSIFNNDNVFVNQTKSFIIAQRGRAIYLFDSEGVVTDITNYIPHNLTLTDVNGEYFVFVNPQTGDIKYLNPRSIKGPASLASTTDIRPEAIQKEMEALTLWNDRILAKRDAFIAQAQAAYKPFFELMPEEYRGEFFRVGREQSIKRLYEIQSEEIIKRYTDALREGKELDLTTPLPFDIFTQRMQQIMQILPAYLEKVRPQLSQEEYSDEINVAGSYYDNIFNGLPSLAYVADVEMGEVNDTLFDALAYGWGLRDQECIDAIPLIARFINDLKAATGQQIKIAEIMKIVQFLTEASYINGTPVVTKQLKRIFNLKTNAATEFLRKLRNVFVGISLSDIIDYSAKPDSKLKSGEARPFVVFLSNDVEPLKYKELFIPKGNDITVPLGGISISQLIKLEQRRPKVDDSVVMDMDYLTEHLNDLPKPSDTLEADILKNTTVQRESGAYAAEITQNSKDATVGMKGELIVDFYLQKDAQGKEEYVEEAQDNGTGALQEVALLIPKSTKAESGQMDLTGFFGTGKYTIFEGTDRVEIITKNTVRAYLFRFDVIKDDSDKPIAIKLTQIREINDDNVKQGVTVRRIKSIDSTIPELDSMLAQRSWKTFAGLAQNENFTIYFIDHEGKKQPLIVEKEILTETDFKAVRPGQNEETNFGKMRIISTKDMPLQIVDKAGLRVSEIKEEYLTLIPVSLRKFIKELGIVIQIPLPLIRNRSGFEKEDEYLSTIQKYVAIEFYKAIAYKTLTQTNPQFVFEGFPLDWETNDYYWNSIDLNDNHLIDLAKKINEGRYGEITNEELKNILSAPGVLDKEKRFLKIILQLEINLPNGAVSLAARRIAIQEQTNKTQAEAQRKILGISEAKIPKISDIPFFQTKVKEAFGIELGHEQMRYPEKYAVEPQTPEELELVKLAANIGRNFGIKEVVLMNDEVVFAGAFRGEKIYLARSLAERIGQVNEKKGFIDEGTDTIVHELGHLLERLIRSDTAQLRKDEVYVTELAKFTHDAVGTFAEAMKYVAAVSLANHSEEQSVASSLQSASSAIEINTNKTYSEVKQEGERQRVGALGSNGALSSSSSVTPGGIDLSKIELTLKDDKFVSSLNPADLKILRAARALKQGWNSLSVLYLHEVMLLLKDGIVNDIQNRVLLQNILNQLNSNNLFDSQLSNFLHLLQLNQSMENIKLALVK